MDACRRGHPRTPENTYVHPRTRKRYCRVCNVETRRNKTATKRPCGKRSDATPLTQAQLDAMRELVRCMVCNAKPYGPVGEQPQTDHAPDCTVGKSEDQQREFALAKAREKAWATRRANRAQRTDAA